MADQHILMLTNLSDRSDHALQDALEEASLHRATLTLLHALSPHARSEGHEVRGAPDVQAGRGRFDRRSFQSIRPQHGRAAVDRGLGTT